ncbi:MAG: T9SS type A sorting domain-containing protein, partial [Saprospiraceae bacterium]
LYDMPASPCDTLGIDTPVSVSELGGTMKKAFVLSPNPASEVLHVQFEAPFMGELVISDLAGRVIQRLSVQDKLQALDISVEQLNNGVYILSCTNSTGNLPSNAKFVVLR